MKLSDNVPVWVREKRQPTREELAAKHFADGGSVGTPASNPQNDAYFDEIEATTPIVVKRYNT